MNTTVCDTGIHLVMLEACGGVIASFCVYLKLYFNDNLSHQFSLDLFTYFVFSVLTSWHLVSLIICFLSFESQTIMVTRAPETYGTLNDQQNPGFHQVGGVTQVIRAD